MRRVLIGAAIAVAAALGASSGAGATIVAPGVGGLAVAVGSVTYTDAILTSRCQLGASGSVGSTTTVSWTAASATGCSAGTVSFADTPYTLTYSLAGTFTITGVRLTVAASIMFPPYNITCIHRGGLSGTYTTGVGSLLTFTGDTLVRQTGSSAACTTDPSFRGTVLTNLTL